MPHSTKAEKSSYPRNLKCLYTSLWCRGPNYRWTSAAVSMLWIFILVLLHCGLNLYHSYRCMSWRVMVEKRLKESTHTILVKELFRPPVHQTYAHAICFWRCCVCVHVYWCICVTWRVKHHLWPIRDALYYPNLSPDYGQQSIKSVEIGQKSSLSL